MTYNFSSCVIRSFRVFVRKALDVNVPVATFFLTVDYGAWQMPRPIETIGQEIDVESTCIDVR